MGLERSAVEYFISLARTIADERVADALAGAAASRRAWTARSELVCVERSQESGWKRRQGCVMIPAGLVA